jgi:hypothetical protein
MRPSQITGYFVTQVRYNPDIDYNSEDYSLKNYVLACLPSFSVVLEYLRFVVHRHIEFLMCKSFCGLIIATTYSVRRKWSMLSRH